MSKGKLVFELPEEQVEFKLASQAHEYAILIDELDRWLRDMSKYHGEEHVKISAVREYIANQRCERGIEE